MRKENDEEEEKASINESMRNFLSTSKDKRAEISERSERGVRGKEEQGKCRGKKRGGVTIVFDVLQRTYTIRSVRTQIR